MVVLLCRLVRTSVQHVPYQYLCLTTVYHSPFAIGKGSSEWKTHNRDMDDPFHVMTCSGQPRLDVYYRGIYNFSNSLLLCSHILKDKQHLKLSKLQGNCYMLHIAKYNNIIVM